MPEFDYFVRLPTRLVEALLRIPLTGTQWRILFWVIRQTYGWHRSTAPFSWYRVAKDASMDRGGVVRAGNRLLRSRILRLEGGEIAVQDDHTQWQNSGLPPQGAGEGGAAMTDVSADHQPPKAMTGVTKSDDAAPQERCQASSFFRRAKESSKERKKYKDTGRAPNADNGHRPGAADNIERQHLAGAAKPVPGKYERLSQN